MAVCIKCKREIPDSEISKKIRKCDYCEKAIGCIYCLVPGTLEYRYCDEHNPKGKKDKKEDMRKYIRELCSDESISKNAEIQLLKNSDVSVDLMIEYLEKGKDSFIKEKILNIFEKIGDERTIDPILKTIKEEYLKGGIDWDIISQAIWALGGINTERALKEIYLLSEHPEAQIRSIVLEFLRERSEDTNDIRYKNILEKILDGRDISEVEEIYEKISFFESLDHRQRESAIRELSAMNSKKELIHTLNHKNPLARASAVMCLGISNKDGISNEGDALVVEKVMSMANDAFAEVRSNVALALGNLNCYDKVFEMTADEDMDVKLSAVDALLSKKDDPKVKELLNKITEESLLNYINNDEYRYSENVKREIQTRLKYATEFFIAENYEECINELKEVLRIDPENSMAHAQLAEVYMRNYKYEEAEKELNEAIKIKDDSYLHLRLGDVLMSMQRLDEAMKEYKNALEIKEITPEEIEEARKNIAEIYNIKEQYKDAEQEYRKILEINPKDVSSRLALAEILKKTNREKEACEEYESVIKQDPFQIDPYIDLSMILIEDGKLKEAEHHLRNAVKIHPKEPIMYFFLGISLVLQERYVEAEREVKKCFSVNTSFANSEDSAEMHELLARAIAAQGRVREAKIEFAKAQKLREKNRKRQNRKTMHMHFMHSLL